MTGIDLSVLLESCESIVPSQYLRMFKFACCAALFFVNVAWFHWSWGTHLGILFYLPKDTHF